jgi:hypothetical protein
MRIWIRNTAFFLANLWIAICGLEHKGNLWICDLRINHYNFADLLFADWVGIPQKFADLQLRNEPKNLRICDLQTSKTFACPPLTFSAVLS